MIGIGSIFYLFLGALSIMLLIEYFNAPEVIPGSIWLHADKTPVRVINVSKYFVECEYIKSKEICKFHIVLFKIFLNRLQ